jgi:hypothetical protein
LSRSAAAAISRSVFDAVSVAFRRSSTKAAAAGIGQAVSALPSAQQVRLGGIALLAFVVVHLALLTAVPASVAPAMPLLLWALVALVALLLITAANPLVRAWHARRRGGLRQ